MSVANQLEVGPDADVLRNQLAFDVAKSICSGQLCTVHVL